MEEIRRIISSEGGGGCWNRVVGNFVDSPVLFLEFSLGIAVGSWTRFEFLVFTLSVRTDLGLALCEWG